MIKKSIQKEDIIFVNIYVFNIGAPKCKLIALKGFPDGSVGKESTCNEGDPGSIPGSRSYLREGIRYPLQYSWVFPVAQMVKNLPAMREIWFQSLGWEDPLEEGMTTPLQYSWLENPHGHRSLVGCGPWGCKELNMTE